MKILDYFKNRRTTEIKEFARSLADEIAKRYPPELDRNAASRPSINRLTRILEDTCEKARKYQQQRQLGILGKAKFGNEFKWTLTDLGYRKEFVDFATEAIVVYISKADNTPKGN